MALSHELLLVGLSHRTAPVSVRENCAVAPDGLPERLTQLQQAPGMQECWVLSTCNRTEVLAATTDLVAAQEIVRDRFFDRVDGAAVYAHKGTEAVFHLFRVAAGLDSQILGESQILAQMKMATDAAREAGTVGHALAPLLQQAFSLGKRVRRETRVGEGTLSVARAAVELGAKVCGALDEATALVVGAGETGVLVARNLVAAGVRDLRFANRTFSRAEKAASEFSGQAVRMEDLRAVLPEMDFVIVSVNAPAAVIGPEQIDDARMRKRDRSPVMIDISVPRAIDPVLEDHPNLLVHSLDDLDAIVARHHQERRAEVEGAERMLVGEVHKWLALRAYSALKPVIAGMRDHFQEVQDAVMAEQRVEDPRTLELMSRLTRRLLDAALVRMKEGARESYSEDFLDRRYRHYLEKS